MRDPDMVKQDNAEAQVNEAMRVAVHEACRSLGLVADDIHCDCMGGSTPLVIVVCEFAALASRPVTHEDLSIIPTALKKLHETHCWCDADWSFEKARPWKKLVKGDAAHRDNSPYWGLEFVFKPTKDLGRGL